MKQSEIERLLPRVFQNTLRKQSPLQVLVGVMEILHRPAEEVLGRIETIFNPYSMPDCFVPYIARWVDLERFFPFFSAQPPGVQRASEPVSTGTGRLRELIAAAAYLSQWRGTARGLTLFLETATGIQGFEIEENMEDDTGAPRAFHIRILAPAEAQTHASLIERIIAQEKPAYVSYEVDFKSATEKGAAT